jgi:hypothetical protein
MSDESGFWVGKSGQSADTAHRGGIGFALRNNSHKGNTNLILLARRRERSETAS